MAPRAARDTSHPSYAGAQKRRVSTKVNGTTCAQITVQRKTFVSRLLTKVPAPPRGEDVSHGARRPQAAASGSPPSLQTARNQRYSNQNRRFRAPNTHRAEERCPAGLLLGALGVGVVSKPVCGKVSPHEPRENDPAYAREKDVRRRQCVENHFTTPRPRCQSCKSQNRPPSGQNCGHRAPTAHRADNERTGCKWVWFHLETNVPKCRRANSGVSLMEPPEKYVSEGDGEKEAPWWNLRRGAKLRVRKTYHRDGNHATRRAKALVPP